MKTPEVLEVAVRSRKLLRGMLVLAISAFMIAIVSCSNLYGDQFETPSGLQNEEGGSAQSGDAIPLPESVEMRRYTPEELAGALRAGAFEAARDRELATLVKLTDIFYRRLVNRRINTIATFHDPALREFFRTGEAFADYYADLVQSLTRSRFEGVRPNRVIVEALMVFGEGRRVTVQVQFRGENSRPLRWWSVYNTREDEWEYTLGQWWVVPRKL